MVWKMDVCDSYAAHSVKGQNYKVVAKKGKVFLYSLPIIGGIEFGFALKGKGQPIIAYVDWRYLQKQKGHTIVTPIMVGVNSDFRGQGLANDLYAYTLALGWAIQAGDIKNVQSRGGASLWNYLAGEYPERVKAKPSPESMYWEPVLVGADRYPYCEGFKLYDSPALMWISPE